MAKYLKLFETHAEYEAYSGGGEMLLPNVSYCKDNNEVHYNPFYETRLIAKFNVTDTDSPTSICYSDAVSSITEIEIDGVVQPSVEYEYTFDTTGEHIVKYTLSDPTSIGDSAFYGCSGMTSVIIPNSVTSIGYGAFEECAGLTSIDIPNSVTSIRSFVFNNCSGLTAINVDENNTAYSSIDGVLFNKSQTELVLYPTGKQGAYTIPNSVTSIGDSAFYVCTGLTSVNIPDSVTSIGIGAFYDCTGLTSVTIPNSVTNIEGETFCGCTGLTSVTIGNSVTIIGASAFTECTGLTSVTIGNSVTDFYENAFWGCTGLTSMVIEATTPPVLADGAFSNTNNFSIYVPSESVDAYKAASGWSTYASRIQPITA